VTAWTTRRGRPGLPAASTQTSPTLLYHKWHAYDLAEDPWHRTPPVPSWQTKTSRLELLERVAQIANGALSSYTAWHIRYFDALTALGVDRNATVLTAKTVWHFVAGLATNPALETGITLHLLHGFPYVPGAAVRGLVRRVAENELMGNREAWLDQDASERPSEDEISQFLTEAERLKAVLGSLAVDPPISGIEQAWRTPRELLRHVRGLLGSGRPSDLLRQRIDALLNESTGGLVTFFDAVPAQGENDLLETDLLNPHYPDFYRNPDKFQPSDDQDPTPVYFLAVRPEAAFEFSFRLSPWPEREPRDEPERRRAEALGMTTRDDMLGKITDWLSRGLKSWGAGAKTAAGYGYFEIVTPKKPVSPT
jgi:CRISPR-associated protein Cmr6